MAVYRKIHVSFWEDTKVIDDMTPEDRYFILYLMTNPHTTQSGCYSITIRQMEFETGYNKDTILKLLKRFTEILEVIEYSEITKELLIKNWYKYNWTKSPKVLNCVVKEAKTIKNKEFRYYINTLLIQYGYSIDTETQEEEEKEKEEKEEINKKEIKNKYGEFNNVLLTDKEYSKLNELYKDKLDCAINILSSYLASKGDKYKNHYAVLNKHNWVYKKLNPEPIEQQNKEYNAYA